MYTTYICRCHIVNIDSISNIILKKRSKLIQYVEINHLLTYYRIVITLLIIC